MISIITLQSISLYSMISCISGSSWIGMFWFRACSSQRHAPTIAPSPSIGESAQWVWISSCAYMALAIGLRPKFNAPRTTTGSFRMTCWRKSNQPSSGHSALSLCRFLAEL